MSNFLSFSVNSASGVYDWVLRKMGHPLVAVEITDEQLTDCLNEAMEEFTEWVIEEKRYIAIDLENYDGDNDCYVLSGAAVSGFNITSIFALEENNVMGTGQGHNTLFSLTNTMWNNGMFPLPGGSGGAEGWINYEAAMQYLDLVKRMTASGFVFEYNPRDRKLQLIPNPKRMGVTGSICFGVNVIRPDDHHYGESWVKRMTLAKAKRVVGTVRAKFTGTQLLGGGSIDTGVKEEGAEEEERCREELREKFMVTDFWVG